MVDADLHLAARWAATWDGASHRLIEHGEVVVNGGVVRCAGRGWRGTARKRIGPRRTVPLRILVRAIGPIWLHGGAAP